MDVIRKAEIRARIRHLNSYALTPSEAADKITDYVEALLLESHTSSAARLPFTPRVLYVCAECGYESSEDSNHCENCGYAR